MSVGMLLAACGDDNSNDSADAAPTSTTVADGYGDDATTTTAGSDAAGDTQLAGSSLVEVATSGLGDILVSGGNTLYAFVPDDGGAPTCYDDCAVNWPPLLADGDVPVGEGLDSALFATATRTDGGEQVTANGWPLYFFAADAAPGDTTGQGVGGKWYVVGADGHLIK
jgi:predicted lipoprotein with Yx(FWY)xxD motif